jgi:hypothetical protein
MKDNPNLHPAIKMETSVLFKNTGSALDGKTGVVAGISFSHIVSAYIVILDEPYYDPDNDIYVRAISMVGSCLERFVSYQEHQDTMNKPEYVGYKDVHTEHCCSAHQRCKYGSDDACTAQYMSRKFGIQSFCNCEWM